MYALVRALCAVKLPHLAQVRDKIRRNIVLLCEMPEGRTGRPSKSLTLPQAETVLKTAEQGHQSWSILFER